MQCSTLGLTASGLVENLGWRKYVVEVNFTKISLSRNLLNTITFKFGAFIVNTGESSTQFSQHYKIVPLFCSLDEDGDGLAGPWEIHDWILWVEDIFHQVRTTSSM